MFDANDWHTVAAGTDRLKVPGGFLYRVKQPNREAPWIGFVSDASEAIRFAGKWLGTGDASTPMGALEAHADIVSKSLNTIGSALADVADHLRQRGF